MRTGVARGQPLSGVPAGGRTSPSRLGNRIAVRIDLGVSHRRRQAIDVGRCELMFGPLGAEWTWPTGTPNSSVR